MDITQHPDLQYLNKLFQSGGYELRLVGGCVRDYLLGQDPKDIDMCTDATPEQMLQLPCIGTIVETGLQHGTLTFVINHTPYEITTLRIDTDTDGRHATVQYTTDFELDAARRDLTFNAMSMDFDGNIYDYFEGRKDLEENVVRFVGFAQHRIEEDYLRILRYFRFAARFDAKMDQATLFSIISRAKGLDKISKERVWLEMSKLVTCKGAYRILRVMAECDVLSRIGLPAINHDRFEYADNAEAAMASFFIGNGAAARNLCQEWKMSTAETDKIVWLAGRSSLLIGLNQIESWVHISDVPRDWIVSALSLRYGNGVEANVEDMKTLAKTMERIVFPVQGRDLQELGMAPGPEMGKTLARLKLAWVDSNFTKSKITLLNSVSKEHCE